MVKLQIICSAAIGALALVATSLTAPVALAQERDQTDQQRNSEEQDTKDKKYKKGELRYERGTMDDMYVGPKRESMARAYSVDDMQAKTKVWVAKEDVASTPGVETIIQHKSPVHCGRLGCEIIIIAGEGDDRRVILRTIGNTVTPTDYDEIVINQGTQFETVWVFDGEQFVQQK